MLTGGEAPIIPAKRVIASALLITGMSSEINRAIAELVEAWAAIDAAQRPFLSAAPQKPFRKNGKSPLQAACSKSFAH
jgi:hypothetical protein